MKTKNVLTVLCVEDDLVVADYISSLLDKKIYHVITINDGKEALEYMLSPTECPDIVILDYHLPSMDGLQILQNLKTNQKSYPVIFLTTDETLETAVKAINAGAIDYLAKSFYLKAELNIKVEKAYQLHQDKLKKDYYEHRISILDLAVEQSPDSVMITDKEGNIQFVNKKFTQFTGYRFEEVKGKNPRLLKTDSYPLGFHEKLWATIVSGRTWKGEFINRKKNNELFYEKATITPIRNKAGEIVSYLGIKEDITELKRAESVIKRKNEEMDRFFSVVVDLLCITESTTRKFLRLNKAWENIFGYSQDELVGKLLTDFIHPDDLELTLLEVHKLKEKGSTLNFVNRFRSKSGEYRFIEWNSIDNNDGTSYSSARDITERKKSEIAIKESEARFRSIFEMANAGIFFTDMSSQIILVNRALQNLLEYSHTELCMMDFSQFTHLDDLNLENEKLKRLINKQDDQYRIEKRYVSKTHKIIWVDLSVAVIRDEANEPLYYVGVVNDISERKQYEQQLKDINLTKDKFFSIISHDLRNQFSGIQGLSEILVLKRETMDPAMRDRYIELLSQGGKNTLTLLENLLEWSRLQLNRVEHDPNPLNLYNILNEVLLTIENQATLKQIEVHNNVSQSQMIFVDKNMISTVLRNLLNNAIKFTTSGGSVTITSWSAIHHDFISIQDTGIGMKQENIDKLFRPEIVHTSFGTEKEKGSGLGLILCREFITKHGGEIFVKSEIGIGSKFIISLPMKGA